MADDKKLDDLLNTGNIPAPTENARKTALNLAMGAFDAQQTEKNQKTFQGSGFLSRLMGMTNPNNRSSFMKRKFIYGGMATAMVVVLAGGVALYQTEQHELVTASDNFAQVGEHSTDGSNLITNSLSGQEERAAIYDTAQVAEEPSPELQKMAEMPQQENLEVMPSHDGHIPAAPPIAPMIASRNAEGGAPGYAGSANAGVSSDAYVGQTFAAAPQREIGIMPPHPPYPMPMPWPEPMPPEQLDRDKFEQHEMSSVKQVALEPVSTFSADVDTASYSFVRRRLNAGVLPPPDAVRIEEMINYFPYNYQGPDSREAPFKANVSVIDSPWKSGNKLIHIGIKGYDVEKDVQPRANLVFLLDVSGSMGEPDKLPLLQSSLKMLLTTLKPDDTIGIVAYAGQAGTVLEPTKVADKAKILAALDGLYANGSTAGAEGIQSAYAMAERNFNKEGVNRIILATDGDFNVGQSSDEELQKLIEDKRKSGIFLSVFGFGEGNLNDSLMQTLAQNGNGVAAHIDNLNEARKVLVDEATSTLFPIAKDVKLQVEFNPETVSEYRLIGYETRALAREDFNNDKVDAGDIGAGHTVTAIYEIVPKGSGNELYGENRYQKVEETKANTEFGDEYAFLKMRYKLPDEETSKLITTPITEAQNAAISPETSFALSVAGFGQLLKNDKYLSGDFGYDDVLKLAQAGKGEDFYGYRAEFINLVRLAQSMKNY